MDGIIRNCGQMAGLRTRALPKDEGWTSCVKVRRYACCLCLCLWLWLSVSVSDSPMRLSLDRMILMQLRIQIQIQREALCDGPHARTRTAHEVLLSRAWVTLGLHRSRSRVLLFFSCFKLECTGSRENRARIPPRSDSERTGFVLCENLVSSSKDPCIRGGP